MPERDRPCANGGRNLSGISESVLAVARWQPGSGRSAGLPNVFWYARHGKAVAFSGPHPSTKPDYRGRFAELVEGGFLWALLAEPESVHLESASNAHRQNESEAEKAERRRRRKMKLERATEANRAKEIRT